MLGLFNIEKKNPLIIYSVMHLLGNVFFYVYKKCFTSSSFSFVFMKEMICGLHSPKQCSLFVHGDCNGTIDMHFILFV